MDPKVSIIILNWNGWEDTIECLESLYQITYPNYNVIVVDNGSEDESVQKIKEYAEGKVEVESKFFAHSNENKPIKIIEYTREETEAGGGKEEEIADLPSNRKLIIIKNEKNYGFAEGNNIGMKYIFKNMDNLDVKYTVTLNNDMVVTPNWITELVSLMQREEVGSGSSKILLYDTPDIINSAGLIFLKDGSGRDRGVNEDAGKYKDVDEIFGACAGAAIYRRSALEEVGGFDEDFFLYYEDLDLAWRLRLAGWKCFYSPKAIVYHKCSKSAGAFSLFSVYYGERNKIWDIVKNFPIEYVVIAPFYHIIKMLFLFYIYSRGMSTARPYSEKYSLFKIGTTMLKAQFDAILGLSQMLNKRREVTKLIKVRKSEIIKWFELYSISLKDTS